MKEMEYDKHVYSLNELDKEERIEISSKDLARKEINIMIMGVYQLASTVESKAGKGVKSREYEALLQLYNDLYNRTHRLLHKNKEFERLKHQDNPLEKMEMILDYVYLCEDQLGFHQIKPDKRKTVILD